MLLYYHQGECPIETEPPHALRKHWLGVSQSEVKESPIKALTRSDTLAPGLMMRIELPGLAQLYRGHTKDCVAVLKGNEYV